MTTSRSELQRAVQAGIKAAVKHNWFYYDKEKDHWVCACNEDLGGYVLPAEKRREIMSLNDEVTFVAVKHRDHIRTLDPAAIVDKLMASDESLAPTSEVASEPSPVKEGIESGLMMADALNAELESKLDSLQGTERGTPRAQSGTSASAVAEGASGFPRQFSLCPATEPEHPTAAYSDLVCQKCGGKNPCWFTDNQTWNKVVTERTGVLCPNCFLQKADYIIPNTGWEIIPENAPRPATDTAQHDFEHVGKVVRSILIDAKRTNRWQRDEQFWQQLLDRLRGIDPLLPGEAKVEVKL